MNLETYGENEPYIFVSYSHKDEEDVSYIINILLSYNYRIWYDEKIIPGTDDWSDEIAGKLLGSELFVAFISEGYITSNECLAELKYANNEQKNILLIYLDDVKLPQGLEMRLCMLQALYRSKYNDNNDFIDKIRSAESMEKCIIEGQCGKKPVIAMTTLKYADGSIYNGQVENNQPEGFGRMIYPDGCSYIGEFKNGRFHGKGKEWYYNIVSYEGDFCMGQPSGEGRETYIDGTEYNGSFRDDMKDGCGKTVYSDGAEYEGEYRNGSINGNGTMTWSDGSEWTGEFRDGDPWNGSGTWHDTDGTILSGVWKDGICLDKK